MMVGFKVNYSFFKVLKLILANSYVIAIGPELPVDCGFGSMVTTPDGFGVILLGCRKTIHRTDKPDNKTLEIGSQIIYRLTWDEGDNLQWSTVEQLLKYPRFNTLAMFIPDNHCGMYKYIYLL